MTTREPWHPYRLIIEALLLSQSPLCFIATGSAWRNLVFSIELHRLALSREFTDAGCLLSYGPDALAIFRRVAEYVDRVARGAKPADLPVEQPTKFELIINVKTAKVLGLTIPDKLLALADEVIE